MKFCALEYALPSKKVTNAEIIDRIISSSKPHLSPQDLKQLGNHMEEMFEKSITVIRYHRADDEHSIQFGIEAGKKALKAANMSPKDIDLLIYVGIGRGFLEPATANVFQNALGLKNATCFDILDACASWMRAMHVAQAFISNGNHKNIMVLNCEFNFREFSNFVFRSLKELEYNFPTFTIGEASTAVIFTGSKRDDEYYASFKTWGYQHKLCKIPLPHLREYSDGELRKIDKIEPLQFFSYGEKIFRFTFIHLCKHYQQDPVFANFKHDIAFSHSASDAMTERVMKTCNLGVETGYMTHKRFGNTVSASVPLGMSSAREEGRLKDGTNVLIGFGSAGVSTAWCKLKFLT